MTDAEFIFSHIALVIIGVVVGANLVLALDGFRLADCARKHNIYACEFVAVPKQPDEARK